MIQMPEILIGKITLTDNGYVLRDGATDAEKAAFKMFLKALKKGDAILVYKE